jgi:hypothetical protein
VFDTLWRQNCLMLLKRTLSYPLDRATGPQCVLADAVLELIWEYWMYTEAILISGGFSGTFATGVRLYHGLSACFRAVALFLCHYCPSLST